MNIDELISDGNIVVNESYVKGYYSKELCLYAIIWEGVFSDEEYIALFRSIVDFATENKVLGVFSDVRTQGKVSPYARDYLKKHISPRGDELIEKVAVLQDGSPFKLLYLNALIKLVGERVRLFSEAEDALNYLIEA